MVENPKLGYQGFFLRREGKYEPEIKNISYVLKGKIRTYVIHYGNSSQVITILISLHGPPLRIGYQTILDINSEKIKNISEIERIHEYGENKRIRIILRVGELHIGDFLISLVILNRSLSDGSLMDEDFQFNSRKQGYEVEAKFRRDNSEKGEWMDDSSTTSQYCNDLVILLTRSL
ncbi:hypothetical protein H8356DRAFT_1430438 [Neocallimastix lanati (nom. inval.)]|nr:hypothetical protein H8356DRAFT_1430438 [Neocallimastix sp. JGI-2020a]